MAKYEEALIQKIKIQYENGKSISKLSKQYSVPTGTIKTWSSTYKWVKKKNSNQPKIKTVEKRTNQPTEMEIGLLHDEDLVTDIVDEVISEEKAKKTYKVFTEKERMFITYYFAYKFNVKAASLAVGYWSEVEGHRVLNKPKIKKIVRRIKQIILERADINFTANELLEELFLVLKKATGEIPQNKIFLISKFDKKTIPVSVRTYEGKLTDGTEVKGSNILGVIEKGSFKDVVKNQINEISYQVPEEYVLKDTDLKAANAAIKLIADLYGFMDNSKLARERFEYEKAKNIEEREAEKNINITFSNDLEE
ncbi:Uncharacterized conserved protein [Sebaldella termitidis]|uniref:Terminase small subunit n=1 Tax=Sebaldella termitidis (strain ATCC 33386 / NCTC 11300) TaxID=526218 RepID=D1AH91_SEBTE|nr:terminase small subunit [Sebaldella termitidis]ACZ08125.1 hypothetical protein Sterm_1258 [Sebaldella termitidis ATCC 33386]MBP9479764.1 terminase small subunit [Sebaldella sp.]SUI23427.1 Uncharacterized conserved protein [Sebaldella termitidis]